MLKLGVAILSMVVVGLIAAPWYLAIRDQSPSMYRAPEYSAEELQEISEQTQELAARMADHRIFHTALHDGKLALLRGADLRSVASRVYEAVIAYYPRHLDYLRQSGPCLTDKERVASNLINHVRRVVEDEPYGSEAWRTVARLEAERRSSSFRSWCADGKALP